MKKLIILALLITLGCPVFAVQEINNELAECLKISDKAKATNDNELFNQYSMCVYKASKKGLSDDEARYINNIAFKSMSNYYANKYTYTKDMKYSRLVKKYSMIAIKNGILDIDTIEAAIFSSALDNDEKGVISAYEYLQKVDEPYAEKIRTQISNIVENIRNTKQLALQEKSDKVKRTLGAILYSAGTGASAYGNTMSNYYNKQTSTHCYTIGNNVYCNSY